eukprot:PhM_4_TR345/c0_g1_i1/m.25429/K20302/TRAPPC3, BET3; trafficking protein particle complex subunit 3
MRAAPTTMQRKADSAFDQQPKVSGELFALTYGTLVRQMTKDSGNDIDSVNHQLHQMGHRIGLRLVDEYLAKAGVEPCRSFKDTASAVSTVGLKMFLGVDGDAQPRATDDGSDAYAVVFRDNPLSLFVELPSEFRATLWYSNVICGVIEGALKMIGYSCTAYFTKDTLRGNDVNEIIVQRKGAQT